MPIYGGSIAQGYLQYLAQQQDAQAKQSQLAESKLRQQMLQRQLEQDLQAQQFQQAVQNAPGPQMGPPPGAQPPQGPGQPSVPMQRPGMPQGGPMPPPPAGAAPGGPAPPQPPQGGGIQLPPAVQQYLQQRSPGAPPAPPQPFIDPSKLQAGKAPPGMQLPPPPEDVKAAAIEKVGAPPDPMQMYKSILDQLEKIDPKNPKNSAIALAKVEQFKPIFDIEQKTQLAEIKAQKQAADEARDFYKERLAELKESELERHHKTTEGVSQQNAASRARQADAAMVRAEKYKSGAQIPPAEDVEKMAAAVADYRLDPVRLSQKGGYREAVLSKALEINPDYDSKEFASQQAFDTTSMRTAGSAAANTAMAAGAAQGGADILEQAAAKVPRTDWKRINSALLAARGESGVPEVGAFEAALNTFVNEYARAVNPKGVATVSDKNHARDLLSTADSPETFKAKMDILRQEMARGRQAPLDVAKDLSEARKKPKPNAGAKKITGDDDYNALPSGALFQGPDGVTRRKP